MLMVAEQISTGTVMQEFLIDAKIVGLEHVAQDILSFELARTDGGELPPYTAGAHIDVHVKDGLVRQYSLCGDPTHRDRYTIAVLKEPDSRGGSIAMHALREGDELKISVPRNHFPLAPITSDDPPALLFAGGVGITPIMAMVRSLADWSTPFELHYCVRSRSRAAFWTELTGIVDEGTWGQRLSLHADDETGPLNLDALFSNADRASHVYVCGPKGFIDAVLSTAKSHGWPADLLHCEYFTASPLLYTPGDDVPFDVQLGIDGPLVHVPAGTTIIEALATHGVEIATSCEQGICGTCITGVLEGVPDHRDMVLDSSERDSGKVMTPCCSRALTSTLVLDL